MAAEGFSSYKLVVDGLVKSKASRRVLGLPDELATILAEHLAQQRLTGADAEALVFSSHAADRSTTRTSCSASGSPP